MHDTDFASLTAKFSVPSRSYQVAALRLYTTAAYSFMNGPLRDDDRYQRKEACPLPVATYFAVQGIKKLRRMHVDSDKQVNPLAMRTGNPPMMASGLEGVTLCRSKHAVLSVERAPKTL